MSGQTPAAGWYPDGSGARRWWDGTSWTTQVLPQDDRPVDTTAPRHTQDAEPAGRAASETAATRSWIVRGGVVRARDGRQGGQQILAGLALLAAFAVLTLGSRAAAVSGGHSGFASVYIGAAGVGALFLLRGLSARYSSTPVVLLGFLGTAVLVAAVLLLPLTSAADAAPTAAAPAAGAPRQTGPTAPAQAPWRPDSRHDWISLGSTAAYWEAGSDAARCAAGTSCAVSVVASRRACARLQLTVDLVDGAGVKRRSTTLVLKDMHAGRGVNARIITTDNLVESYRITAARCR